MEPIVTHLRPRWQARMVLLVMAFVVFAAWFAYDGTVMCPAFNQRAAVYNALVVDQARRGEWLALATQKGWPAEFSPEEAEPDGRVRLKGKVEIRLQFAIAGASLLVALVLVVRVALNRRLSVLLDDEGLRVGESHRIPMSRIAGIDRQRWESRGIVRVEYADEQGARRHVILNDSVHANVAEIAAWIESQLPAVRSAS